MNTRKLRNRTRVTRTSVSRQSRTTHPRSPSSTARSHRIESGIPRSISRSLLNSPLLLLASSNSTSLVPPSPYTPTTLVASNMPTNLYNHLQTRRWHKANNSQPGFWNKNVAMTTDDHLWIKRPILTWFLENNTGNEPFAPPGAFVLCQLHKAR